MTLKNIMGLAAVLACVAAGPVFAGDGGQAVKAANQALHAAGTNLGQAIQTTREVDPDFKLGPVVSDLNH